MEPAGILQDYLKDSDHDDVTSDSGEFFVNL